MMFNYFEFLILPWLFLFVSFIYVSFNCRFFDNKIFCLTQVFLFLVIFIFVSEHNLKKIFIDFINFIFNPMFSTFFITNLESLFGKQLYTGPEKHSDIPGFTLNRRNVNYFVTVDNITYLTTAFGHNSVGVNQLKLIQDTASHTKINQSTLVCKLQGMRFTQKWLFVTSFINANRNFWKKH